MWRKSEVRAAERQPAPSALVRDGASTGAKIQPDSKGCPCKRHSLLLRATAVWFLVGLIQPASPIAQYNMRADLPAGVRNAIVRVSGITGSEIDGGGSGTVIQIHPVAHGWWLCVLTADHVVGFSERWAIGFGNGGYATGTRTGEFTANIMYRGPVTIGDARADIALLGVFVADMNGNGQLDEIPEITPLSVAEPPHYYIVAAGYGWWGYPGDPRRYNTLQTYGLFENGRNTWDNPDSVEYEDITHPRGQRYFYQRLRANLDFFPWWDWPPSEGEAMVLPGDSGGPTLQFDEYGTRRWFLTGVHSVGQGGESFVQEGAMWADVHAGHYQNWINQACDTIPEPGSLCALALGTLSLLVCRRRNRA